MKIRTKLLIGFGVIIAATTAADLARASENLRTAVAAYRV
jgi:hypothetical protein